MKLTCLCMYHGRNWLLDEAVESYLRQEPCGIETELLILSDIQEQRLDVSGLPGVRVVETPDFAEVAAKQNAGVEMAGEWVTLWDDDDIRPPWSLDVMLDWVLTKIESQAVCSRRAWYTTGGPLTLASNLFAGASLFNRDYYQRCGGAPVGGFADRGSWAAMKAGGHAYECTPCPQDVPLIYRWQPDVYHDSGGAFANNAALRHNHFHRKVVEDKRFMRGVYKVTPRWERDYVADIESAIREGRTTV